MSLQHPIEIYQFLDVQRLRLRLRPRTVTQLNSVLSQVAMYPLESFWFPGANGDKVQGFLVKPPNSTPARSIP